MRHCLERLDRPLHSLRVGNAASVNPILWVRAGSYDSIDCLGNGVIGLGIYITREARMSTEEVVVRLLLSDSFFLKADNEATDSSFWRRAVHRSIQALRNVRWEHLLPPID